MSVFERHYSAKQIAEKWGLSAKTIIRLFEDEPGVVKIGSPETRFKRKYESLRIPESVMLRVHTRIATRK